MTMKGAHWHLLVNHFPIIGGLMATIVLGYGLWRRNEAIVRFGFGLFLIMSMTNQTGERAEQYLKSINALDRPRLHEHEKAADLANLGMYLTGVLSLLALVWQRAEQWNWLPMLFFIVSLITFGLMANVGRLGGLIIHQELRDTGSTPTPEIPQ